MISLVSSRPDLILHMDIKICAIAKSLYRTIKVLAWYTPIDESDRKSMVDRVRHILDTRGLRLDDSEVKSLSTQEADL